MKLPAVRELKRIKAPTVTPQALAWDGEQFWMSSRDLGLFYKVRAGLAPNKGDLEQMEIVEELDSPGVIWAAVATNGAVHCTIGKGTNDDRYIYRYEAGNGFTKLFACPDFAGSYLSYDGENLYMSQWYEQRILKFDKTGKILRKIDIGGEICGHMFVNGALHVLRGTENVPRPQYAGGPPTPARFKEGAKEGEEQWWIARVDGAEVVDIAKVPFACRSLTFDGENFWSNHRAANETVCFALPN